MAELTASTSKPHGGVRRNRMSTRIDLTAMVDLAFLLITFFILTTTLSKPKAFNVAMPEDTGEMNVPASRTMTICLGKNDQVVSYLGLTESPITTPKITGFSKEGIRQQIIELSKQVTKTSGKDMIVLLKASDHAVYQDMVGALDELHIAGVDRYAIVDITPKEVALLKQKGVY
ncbi:MAG: biopolymer transporter ExbD [Mucilaginibacter sp.]|uniref:ExbD/TolR family protein n=1 Tax=Mucilaginibacter sp. TaxID=1882438 RepID=UPI003266C284